SADTTGANFSEIYICGDSILSHFMSTGKVIAITSIHPNPSQDEIEVDLESAANSETSIEIFDALGVKVYSEKRIMKTGKNSIHLDTKSLSSGAYILRAAGASQSFVKAR
ncbi:MAG: T9SS type A sorting domain-containing protein, partial [Ignavibacteriota bacterium]